MKTFNDRFIGYLCKILYLSILWTEYHCENEYRGIVVKCGTRETISTWHGRDRVSKSRRSEGEDWTSSIAITARSKASRISKVEERATRVYAEYWLPRKWFPDYVLKTQTIPFVTFTAFRSPRPSGAFERNCLQSLGILQTETYVCVHFSITFQWKSFLHSFMLAATIISRTLNGETFNFINQSVRTISFAGNIFLLSK